MINKIGKKVGFTLTEILLAIVILGIIAAMVLPSVITKYNLNSLDKLANRIHSTLQESIDSLPVTENRDFFETMMYYHPTEGQINYDYDDSSGKFLKKYMRVSRYCGVNAGNCFATKYYEHVNGQKNEFTPSYDGACASLKNGASICLTPQVWTDEGDMCPKVLVDLNGKKGPNVMDIDLREFNLDCKTRTVLDRTPHVVNIDERNIGTNESGGIADPPSDDCNTICEENPDSESCYTCQCKADNNITVTCENGDTRSECILLSQCVRDKKLQNKCIYTANCTRTPDNGVSYICTLSIDGSECNSLSRITLHHSNMSGDTSTGHVPCGSISQSPCVFQKESGNTVKNIYYNDVNGNYVLGYTSVKITHDASNSKSGYLKNGTCEKDNSKLETYDQYKSCKYEYVYHP